MSHLRGPLNLERPPGQKSDTNRNEWLQSLQTCRSENIGDTACHKLFILLGNVLKCWTFRHDLKIRLDVTRALETPPNGKFVMLERRQHIHKRVSRVLLSHAIWKERSALGRLENRWSASLGVVCAPFCGHRACTDALSVFYAFSPMDHTCPLVFLPGDERQGGWFFLFFFCIFNSWPLFLEQFWVYKKIEQKVL